MNWPAKQRLMLTVFTIALVPPVVTAYLSWSRIERLRELDSMEESTEQFLGQIDSLVAQVTEAEASERGYIITGDERFFESYTAAVQPILVRQSQLGSTAPQRFHDTIDSLDNLISRKIEIMNEKAEIRKKKGFEAASASFASMEGEIRMKEIRSSFKRIESNERIFLGKQRRDIIANRGVLTTLHAVGSAMVLCIGAFVFILLARQLTLRERTEQALRAIQERLQFLVSTTPAAIYTCMAEPPYRATYVSDNIKVQTGYEPKEFTENAEFWMDHIHPDDAAGVAEGLFRFSEREHFSHEYRFRRKDGTYIWMHDEIRRTRDREGKPGEIVGYCIDITERKQTEEAVWRAENKYRTLFESANDAIFLLSEDTFVECNRSAERMFDRRRDDLLNRKPYEFSPPKQPDGRDSQEKALEKIHAALSGKPQFFEWSHQLPNGTIFDAEVSLNSIEIGAEKLLQAIVRDVGERKRAEEALRAADILLEKTFASLSEAVFIVDPATRNILACNPAVERIFGYSKEEIVGRNTRFLHESDDTYEAFGKELFASLSAGGVFQKEYRLRRKDGSVLFSEHVVTDIADAAGHRSALVSVVRDITKRRQAVDTLQQYNERLQMLHGIERATLNMRSPEEIADTALDRLDTLIPCKRTSIACFDTASGTMRVLSTTGAEIRNLEKGSSVPLEVFGNLSDPTRREVAIVNDIAGAINNGQVLQAFRAAGIASFINVPLVAKDTVIGMLNLAPTESARLTDEHLEIVREIADSLAVAFRHIRLIAEVRESKERLQALSHRLLEVQESERRRIAYELHDEIGQVLTAVELNLHGIRQFEDAKDVPDRLDESIALIERSLHQVRDLSVDLRPWMLDQLGLVPSLRWYIDRQAQRGKLKARFRSEGFTERLPSALEIACFRVVQESLTNILRHAQATEVQVTLERIGDELAVQVFDNGIGFDAKNIKSRAVGEQGLGLLGMEERILLLNGSFRIESAVGKGTSIHFRLPLGELKSERSENHIA